MTMSLYVYTTETCPSRDRVHTRLVMPCMLCGFDPSARPDPAEMAELAEGGSVPVQVSTPARSIIWRFRTPRQVREAQKQVLVDGPVEPYTPQHKGQRSGRSWRDRLLGR